MAKVVILGSHDCDTCAELRELIKKTGYNAEFIDMDSEEGLVKADELAKRGLVLDSDEIPSCIVDFGDRFESCDAKGLFERLKKKSAGSG